MHPHGAGSDRLLRDLRHAEPALRSSRRSCRFRAMSPQACP